MMYFIGSDDPARRNSYYFLNVGYTKKEYDQIIHYYHLYQMIIQKIKLI